MIIEIAEATGIGAAFALGWMAKHFIVSKKIVKEEKVLTNVYPFEPFNSWHCPQCGLGWRCESVKWCDCEEYYEGHFHMECRGTRNKQPNVGCGFKWMMLSKVSSPK